MNYYYTQALTEDGARYEDWIEADNMAEAADIARNSGWLASYCDDISVLVRKAIYKEWIRLPEGLTLGQLTN